MSIWSVPVFVGVGIPVDAIFFEPVRSGRVVCSILRMVGRFVITVVLVRGFGGFARVSLCRGFGGFARVALWEIFLSFALFMFRGIRFRLGCCE